MEVAGSIPAGVITFLWLAVSHAHHHQRVLVHEDARFIAALIEHRHCIYLDEIQEELGQNRYIHSSIPTLV